MAFFSSVRKKVQQKHGCATTEAFLVVSSRHSLRGHALCILQLLLRRRSVCVPFYSPSVFFFPLGMETQAWRKADCTPMDPLNGVTRPSVSSRKPCFSAYAQAHCWFSLICPPVIFFLLVCALSSDITSLKSYFNQSYKGSTITLKCRVLQHSEKVFLTEHEYS